MTNATKRQSFDSEEATAVLPLITNSQVFTWPQSAIDAIANGFGDVKLTPTTFLIDVTVQAVFLVSWVAIMFRQVGRQAEGATPAVG